MENLPIIDIGLVPLKNLSIFMIKPHVLSDKKGAAIKHMIYWRPF